MPLFAACASEREKEISRKKLAHPRKCYFTYYIMHSPLLCIRFDLLVLSSAIFHNCERGMKLCKTKNVWNFWNKIKGIRKQLRRNRFFSGFRFKNWNITEMGRGEIWVTGFLNDFFKASHSRQIISKFLSEIIWNKLSS